jgi:hypothetical protein
MSQSAKKGAANGEFPIVKFVEGQAIRSLDQGKLYQAKVIRVGADDQCKKLIFLSFVLQWN